MEIILWMNKWYMLVANAIGFIYSVDIVLFIVFYCIVLHVMYNLPIVIIYKMISDNNKWYKLNK